MSAWDVLNIIEKTDGLAKLNSEEDIQISFNDMRIIYPSRFFPPSVIYDWNCPYVKEHGTTYNDYVHFELP